MKKILFAFAVMITLAACGNKQAFAPAEGDKASNEIAFEVAKNYFFNQEEIKGRYYPKIPKYNHK